MNKCLLSLLILFIISCNDLNKNNFQQYKMTDPVIVNIRKIFNDINRNINSYDKTERTILGMSTEGGSVIAYTNRNIFYKIDLQLLGETGKLLYEFYFNNNKIIFIYYKYISYGGHISEISTENKIKNIIEDESRFYFYNNELIKWISFKNDVPYKDNDYLNKKNEMMNLILSLQLLMTTKPESNRCKNEWECINETNGRCYKYKCFED